MRAKFLFLAIVVQFLALGWMAGQREWITRTGPTVWLRTAPIDPRDLFRGDYVTLGYDISTIPASKFGPALRQYQADQSRSEGRRGYRNDREIVVFAALDKDPETGVATVSSVDLARPATGLFIKGRARPYFYDNTTGISGVAYGIDAWFVQQGEGRALERRAPEGIPEGFLVPLEMQVALGRDGTAVLKDYRRNPLGMLVKIPDKKNLVVSFCNASEAPLAVVLPPDLRTLTIQEADGMNNNATVSGAARSGLPPLADADVRVIKPAETVDVPIDLSRPVWFVREKEGAAPARLGSKPGSYHSYRIVYDPPPADACRHLKEAARITRGSLAGNRLSIYDFRED